MARDKAYQEAERKIEAALLEEATELDLKNMGLTELPPSVGNLVNLKILKLGADFFKGGEGNQLTTLPPEIGQLTQLQGLFLDENQLTTLPPEIGQLTQLQGLFLKGNQLTTLPAEIGQLTQLQGLFLKGNQIKTLPDSIGKLEKLEILLLGKNPLQPELAAAYEQGINAVKAYLQEQSKAEILLNEAKLVLAGEGEVGKTSLLNALQGKEFVENRPTTHGVEVDIQSFEVLHPHNNTSITLNAWDFGGQNIYRHTHQIFFTAPAIYLAVWNPRRGAESCQVEEWLKMVKHRAYDETLPEEKPRIIIVATHASEERLDHIDRNALLKEFGNLIEDFCHVDSKTEKNLEHLKTLIAETAAKIPQVRRSVAASFQALLQTLRQQSEPWITYEEFIDLCREQKVERNLAKIYAAILNELGHLIHYSTDPLLKDTIILKPEWLSKAISFILEDKQVKKQNGLVRYERLCVLWNNPDREEQYPENLYPMFLKLMERFDLSYQVELPTPTYLIAQLVPTIPPNYQKDWVKRPEDREQTSVIRIFDAETGRTTKVEGLMYRLIVRLHRFSLGIKDYNKSRHWKNGLLLEDKYNGRALIEEMDSDITITVRALYPNTFLDRLCGEVEWLVNYFWKGLAPRLHLMCPTDNCKGLLEQEAILEHKKRGIPEFQCSVCREFHDIDALMATKTAKPAMKDLLKELEQTKPEILQAVNTNFDSLSAQLRTLMSQADEQYKALLTTLTDPAKEGPRLFSFESVNPSKFNPKTWTKKTFRLTLWCEHSHLSLPVLNGDNDTRGVYEIELTRDWVKQLSPLLQIVSFTLKLALPIAIPGTKLVTDETQYNAIAEQLEFGIKSANSFLQGGDKMGEWLASGDRADFSQTITRNVRLAQGSLLRELHAILKKKDPGFGGLERVQNKRREFLWVHPNYVNKY